MADQREELKETIKRLLWKIQEIESTVCDFDGDQTLLQQRINQLVAELATLESQREALAFEVPVELLRYVDEGGNPDAFTSELFRRALRNNQSAKGKVEAFRQFRGAVEAQVEQADPQGLAAYRALLAASDMGGAEAAGGSGGAT